jgi:hypothetical protein
LTRLIINNREVAKGDRHGFDSYTRRIPADENGRLGRGWERGLEAVKRIYQTAGAAGSGRDEIASRIKDEELPELLIFSLPTQN